MTDGYQYEMLSAPKEKKVADLQAAISRKETAEARALAIVHKLIDDPVTAEELLAACAYICRGYYDDVVEERAIDSRCGYPLCCKAIQPMPNKKYHISLKYNKVFDVSERKNFCSSLCFKASKHLKSQLNSSVIDGETTSEISLYITEEKTIQYVGPEVDLKQHSSAEDSSEQETKTERVVIEKRDEDELLTSSLNTLNLDEEDRLETAEPHSECRRTSVQPADGSVKKELDEPSTDDKSRLTPLCLVEKCLLEWFTVESATFLTGGDLSCADGGEAQNSGVSNEVRELSEYELRVQRFYGMADETSSKKIDGVIERDAADTKTKPVLPLVDSRSQKAIRRRIVLDRINKVSDDLFRAMKMSANEAKTDLRPLVHTFQLNAKNVCLKPAEWSVVTIVLLHLLSMRNNSIRDAMQTESAQKFLTILLKSFGQDLAYLRRVTDWLMSVHK